MTEKLNLINYHLCKHLQVIWISSAIKGKIKVSRCQEKEKREMGFDGYAGVFECFVFVLGL